MFSFDALRGFPGGFRSSWLVTVFSHDSGVLNVHMWYLLVSNANNLWVYQIK